MEELSVFGALRILFGLSVTIANFIAFFVLFKCKKMAFQIRTMTIQLTFTDAITGMIVTVGGFTPNFMCQISHITQIAVTYICKFLDYCNVRRQIFRVVFPVPISTYSYITTRSLPNVGAVAYFLVVFTIDVALVENNNCYDSSRLQF